MTLPAGSRLHDPEPFSTEVFVTEPYRQPLIINNRELTPEEEYFAREEAAKLKKLRADSAASMARHELDALRDAHWMRCPKCGQELHEVDFQGVRMDRCFGCGGSFFDAGEVEKLIERHPHGVASRLNTIFG